MMIRWNNTNVKRVMDGGVEYAVRPRPRLTMINLF